MRQQQTTRGGEDERSPLLAAPQQDDAVSETGGGSRSGSRGQPKYRVIILVSLVLVFYLIGASIFVVPLNGLVSDHLCRKLFPSSKDGCQSDPAERDTVSAEFAELDAWTTTFTLLPSLISSVPFGVLADKVGRRTTFFLNTVGLTLATWYSIFISTPNARNARMSS